MTNRDQSNWHRLVRMVAIACLLAAALGDLSIPKAYAVDSGRKDNPSGLVVPRFVSLKADRVRVRSGPGTDHKISWVYQSIGLPVEVIQEFQTWRRIRDSDGTTGWVYQGMLSGRRTVVVLPWDAKAAEKPKAELYTRENANSPLAALVEAGAVGSVRACDGTWCELTFGSHIGFMMQKKLWGVYPGEFVR